VGTGIFAEQLLKSMGIKANTIRQKQNFFNLFIDLLRLFLSLGSYPK
jgi:hypothetical protein